MIRVLSLFQLTLTFALAHAFADDRVVELPCIPDEATEVRPDQLGLRRCSGLKAEVRNKAEARIQQHVDAYYQGCDVDPRLPKPTSPDACQGRKVSKEICNMFPGTFNRQTAEGVNGNDSNHVGTACGNWAAFEARLDGSSCKVTPDHRGSNYRKEDSFTRGAWIQALNCHFEQVKNEIARGKLTLTGPAGVEGPCAEMAREFEERRKQMEAAGGVLQTRLTGQKNIQDIENCTETAASSLSENPDVGKLRQSACQLVTARTYVEVMATYLSVCEVYARAERSYQTFLAGIGDQKVLHDAVVATMNGCTASRRGAAGCTAQVISGECYEPRFLEFFRQSAARVWTEEACR